MLHIFFVDTGTMLMFDMNLTMERVSNLQLEIASRYHIPRDKQVLLINGGESLDNDRTVCSYSAGTDTNPIFLFSKQSLEHDTFTSNSTFTSSDGELQDLVDGSMNMTPSYETVVTRTQLALQFFDTATEDFKLCKSLVHDQHLQHQGWMAVIANLEDITSSFRVRSEAFIRSYDQYLKNKGVNLDLLTSFPNVVDLLSKIPLLPTLQQFDGQMTDMSPGSTSQISLLEWINAQDKRNTLQHMVQQCEENLAQFNEQLKETLLAEVQKVFGLVDNPGMKEIKGLEERLSGLEQLMFNAQKIVDDQGEISQGFVQNQNRVRNIQDQSVLPDLCSSHQQQLKTMLKSSQSLQDIRRRCAAAKDELSKNLIMRLKWVMYVEKCMCEVDSRLVVHLETLKKMVHRIEIIKQIISAPEVYCRAIVEVVRRRMFSSLFLQWGKEISETCSAICRKEQETRDAFDSYLQHHFLRTLFPGIDDSCGVFANEAPSPFDNRLPPVNVNDITFLQTAVPELSDKLQIPKEEKHLTELLSVQNVPAEPADSVPADQPTTETADKDVPSEERQPSVELPGKSDDAERTMNDSSQSVEIITQEEAIDVCRMSSTVTPTDREIYKLTSGTFSEGGEPFMTADFYFDESMPSSVGGDVALNRKVAELQNILQEKISLLEEKEKEMERQRQWLVEHRAKEAETLKSLADVKEKLSELGCSLTKGEAAGLRAEVCQLSSVTGSFVKKLTDAIQELHNRNETLLREETARAKDLESRLGDAEKQLADEKTTSERSLDLVEMWTKKHEDRLAELNEIKRELEVKLEEKEDQRKTELNQLMLENELELDRVKEDAANELEKKSDHIESLQERISSLERTVAEIQNEKDMLSEKFAEKYQKDKENILNSMEKDYSDRVQQLAETIRAEFFESHFNELEQIRREFDAKLEAESAKVQEQRNLMDAARGQHQQEMAELAAAHLKEMSALKEKNAKELEEMRTQRGKDKSEYENKAAAEVSRLTELNVELMRESTELKKEHKLKEDEQTREINKLEEQRSSGEALLKTKQQELEDQERKMSGLETELKSYQEKVEELQKTSVEKTSVASQCDVTSSNVDELQAELDELRRKYAEVGKMLIEVKRNADERLQSDVDRLQTGLDELVKKCSEKKQEIEKRIPSGASLVESKSLMSDLAESLPREEHDRILLELTDRLEAEKQEVLQKEMRSHQEQLDKLFAELMKLQADKQVSFNDALVKVVSERDQEIASLRAIIQGLENERQPSVQVLSSAPEQRLPDEEPQSSASLAPPGDVSQSQMMSQSFAPIVNVEELKQTIKMKEKENAKLQKQLMELSMTCSVREVPSSAAITTTSCSDGDAVLFVWDDRYGHYVAYLTTDMPTHFLHADSLEGLGLTGATPSRTWVVVEVLNKDHCLAKREKNRFKVGAGTKFYRVKARRWYFDLQRQRLIESKQKTVMTSSSAAVS